MRLWSKLRRMWAAPEKRMRLVTYSLAGTLAGIVGLFLLTTVVFALFSLNLPDPNKIIRREGLSTIIYDRSGGVLYDVYNRENRIPLELVEMPLYLRQATIAIEDKDFYKHQGISLTGLLRSVRNIVTLRGATGGSTLTQQLVKNVLLSPERTVFRKIREAILANQIEKKFTKDQILQMYLNETPYGGATYGVESAARTYFGKSAKDLTLIESVVLAALPQQPTYYSPFGAYPQAYVERAKQVLRRMREDGYITPQQENDVARGLNDVSFATVSGMIKAPHFVFYVKDQLVEKFGEQTVESGGLRVTTTLDASLQEETEKIVREEVQKIKPLKVGNGAAVAENIKTGEILAMVGSYDFWDKDYGRFNVTLAPRQPGSAGKPFIYATAFAKNYTAAATLVDAKTEYPSGESNKPNYIPENYDGKYRGPTQLRFALGNSINTVAVKLTALLGLKDIMTTGFNAGISTWEPTEKNMNLVGLSLALGGREVKLLELANAYAVFGNGGVKAEPVGILKVTDSKGRVLYEHRAAAGRRIFSEEVSFLVSHILSDNNARKEVFGETSYLIIPGRTVAVKTGTTDQKRDNWTVGYDQNVVAGVWVGNNDNTVMAPAVTSGVTGAAPIWNRIMKAALKDYPPGEFKKPEKIVAATVDALGGGLPHGGGATRSEYFVRGTEPAVVSPIYKKLKVSKINGKIANEMEIKIGDYEEKEYIAFSESDPVSEAGKNRWQEAIDKWVAENRRDDKTWNPPLETSDANINLVRVNWDIPRDHEQVNANDVQIRAKAVAVREIVRFIVEVDGAERINKAAEAIDEKINLTDGKHKIVYKAADAAGNSGSVEINIGVNVPWDYSPPATTSASFGSQSGQSSNSLSAWHLPYPS